MDQLVHLPLYVKVLLALGGGTMLWKAVQGSVPKIIAWLLPLALHGTDVAMGFVLVNPVARWLVLGNKDKSKELLNSVIDGVQSVIDAMQKRAIEDIDAASDEPAKADETPKPDEPPKE